MARAATKIYVPLDVMFFDDDKVLRAGERAAWLYLAILAKVKALDTGGTITREQVGRLGIPGWQARLKTLVDVGLVILALEVYVVPSWERWNESPEQRAERLRKDRERKANRKGDSE